MWTTRLAFAGKCGERGSSEAFSAAQAGDSKKFSPSNAARLSAPKPMPARCKKRRRVRKLSSKRAECSCLNLSLVLIRLTIRVQEYLNRRRCRAFGFRNVACAKPQNE